MESQRTVQVGDKVSSNLLVPLSTQHMSAMSGASILVPFIFGINLAVMLFMNGVSTLLFIGVTKGKAPAYLGSNFTFLTPAGVIINNFGYGYAPGGFVVIGFCGCILAFIIHKFGTEWIEVVLPPVAMDPVVVLIELELSGSVASNAELLDEALGPRKAIVFVLTPGIAVFGSILSRRFFLAIPILIAVIIGHMSALACGIIDLTEVTATPVLTLPNFSTSRFNLEAIITILPVLLIIISEYIGYQVVTSKIVGRDLLKGPDLHRPLFGDNFSTMISELIGSVPITTHGENIRVMAITRIYGVYVIAGTAVLSITCSFIGRFSILISTIPGPVTDDVSFPLYGMIGASGPRILADSRVDYGNSRSLTPTLVVFVTGLSGITAKFGNVQLTGMVLVCVVGMTLSLVFYALDYFKLTNDQQLARRETPAKKCLTSAGKPIW